MVAIDLFFGCVATVKALYRLFFMVISMGLSFHKWAYIFTDSQQVFWAITVSHHADRFETRRQKRFAYQETFTVRTPD